MIARNHVTGGRVVVYDGMVETLPDGAGGVEDVAQFTSAPDNPRGGGQAVRRDRSPESRSRWRLLQALASARIGPCSRWAFVTLTTAYWEPSELRAALQSWLGFVRSEWSAARYVWMIGGGDRTSMGRAWYHVHVLAWLERQDWPSGAGRRMRELWEDALGTVREASAEQRRRRRGRGCVVEWPRSGRAVERYITRSVATGWPGRRWGMSQRVDRRPVAEAVLSAAGMRRWRRLVRRWVRGRGLGGRRYARHLASARPETPSRVLMPADVAVQALGVVLAEGGVVGQVSESPNLVRHRARRRAEPGVEQLPGPWREDGGPDHAA